MIPWTHLASAHVPGGGELRLKRRGDEFSIMLGRDELMNSRRSGSEAALAEVACERLAGRPEPAVLIGGLGMGFTLRAALGALGEGAAITVCELVPEIVAWARGPMGELFGGCLDDPRVTVVKGDVGDVIGAADGAYDAILLDVDNGPEGLVRSANDGLYTDAGLAAARAALRPGGLVAVWSSNRDEAFTARLKRAGFAVEEVTARAGARRRGARHVIWIAVRPAGA